MYDQLAKRYYEAREKYFIEKEKDKDGKHLTVNRLEAIASLGRRARTTRNATSCPSSTGPFGIVYHEHQARV